jgi:hypothetical protein
VPLCVASFLAKVHPKVLGGAATNHPLFDLQQPQTKEIEMKLTSMYGIEAFEI